MKIVGTNFRYNTEYDYSDYRDCSAHGCDDEGICRCGTIENAHVISVNIPSMVNEIHGNYFDNTLATKRNSTINNILGGVSKEIDIYTIDRILRINKVYEPTNWEVQVCGGYYGQEIDDIILDDSIARKVEDQLDKAFDIIDLTERIEYLLMLEYGELLPSLQGCKYSVETVERDSIIFGSDEHYRKVNSKNLEHYSDKKYQGIRGIALVKGDKFRLIDGYHRSSTSENRTIKLLVGRS
jgi:hypothetical protein